MLAEIIGPDIFVVLAVLAIALLFGGASQIPKLARGLGEAQREFHKGLHGADDAKQAEATAPATPSESEKTLEA
jgi:TatA/E family protein of Tat protein translocase